MQDTFTCVRTRPPGQTRVDRVSYYLVYKYKVGLVQNIDIWPIYGTITIKFQIYGCMQDTFARARSD